MIAAAAYVLTMEPSVSWWDCGEFVAASYKLQIGHPPGAPLYLMAGRIFSLFAADREHVALMINLLSVLASAFTVMFLFRTITHLCRKLLITSENYTRENIIIIIGCGLAGALTYAFSDTFWFSAVEAEVYGLSSLFTAVVFWAILKWENVADDKHSDRWIILIAWLMGLSIGVHLLNLLAIPAIALVYYFKRFRVTASGLVTTLAVSFIILLFVMYGIISGLLKGASFFELLFVNKFGFGFNTGVWFFFILLLLILGYGIYYSHKRGKLILNIVLLSFTMILTGYSSYLMIIIRSSANPPMDENNPNNVFAMQYYLNREQYGDRPLVAGHNFDSKVLRDESGYPVIEDGRPVYRQDRQKGTYEVAFFKPRIRYAEKAVLFPRMYSRDLQHIRTYRAWGLLKEGEKAGFVNNLAFFINYQLGHMYFRYFMWNFAGKQNDIQSHGSLVNGNWISGIKVIDEFRLGNQSMLPDRYKAHPARNTYYILPLLLGLSGLLYHSSRHRKDFWVVMHLFLMTGIAIVVYLNQTPYQPRERDYAYAGSFYAFSIWVGLGVASVYSRMKNVFRGRIPALVTVLLCLLLVPGIMAQQNLDDHNRSGRYTVADIAKNYLDSCGENAILFTNGDNDTFPLWYVQDVEGYRTDVRVVNLMLLNADWYIEQLKRKAYKSDPLPVTLPEHKYREGVNSVLYMAENPIRLRLDVLIEGIISDDQRFKEKTRSGEVVDIIPGNRFILSVDTSVVIQNGTITRSDIPLLKHEPEWEIEGNQLPKSSLIQMDILAGNNWERPVYFITGGNEGALGLEDYFQLEGLAYRLVPVKTSSKDPFFDPGRVNTDVLFENLMNRFSWGRMNEDDVYLDHFNIRTFAVIKFRKSYIRLAEALIEEGNPEKAEIVLDRCMELAPHAVLPLDHFISGICYEDDDNEDVCHTGIIETYYKCGAMEKANSLLLEYGRILLQDISYYNSLNDRFRLRFEREAWQSYGLYKHLMELAAKYSQEDIIRDI